MGLPFALDHINLWLLRDELDGRAGWTIVDCGITSDATRAAWEEVFAHELQDLPVLRVIVTHMHPDHIGLAHWLTERWQCRLWISAKGRPMRTQRTPGAISSVRPASGSASPSG
jgi:glyoxylase-like metal-dependent hydrolase (beta-lactamase superfamily II)